MALHEASRRFHCSSVRTMAEVSWHLTISHLGLYYSQGSRVSLAPFSPWATQVALVVKNPPANAGDERDWVRSLGWEDPLEEGKATHSSILT